MIDEGGYTSQTIFNVDEIGIFGKKYLKEVLLRQGLTVMVRAKIETSLSLSLRKSKSLKI